MNSLDYFQPGGVFAQTSALYAAHGRINMKWLSLPPY